MSKPLKTQILEGAVALLSDPGKWCSGSLGKTPLVRGRRTRNNVHEPKDLEMADQFCAMGAIYYSALLAIGRENHWLVVGREVVVEVEKTILSAQNHAGISPLAWVNDQQGREAILHIFKQYLEKANG